MTHVKAIKIEINFDALAFYTVIQSNVSICKTFKIVCD